VQLPANWKHPSKLSGAWACRAAWRKVLEHVALGHRVVQCSDPRSFLAVSFVHLRTRFGSRVQDVHYVSFYKEAVALCSTVCGEE